MTEGVTAWAPRSRARDCGVLVWVNDIYEERAAEVAAELGGPDHARPVKADVTSPLKILRMREETGPVDILVNNAGIPTSGFALKKFVDTSPGRIGRRHAPQPRRGARRGGTPT